MSASADASADAAEAEPAWVVATVAGTRHVGSRDGEARGATFASPRCVLPLPNGSLLVVDSANNRLRRIADGGPDGGGPVVTTVAPKALFFNPRCIALLPDGSVLVCNTGHNRLARLCLETNTSSHYAGCGRKGHRDGPAHSAEFSSPSGVCVCGDGTVLVADTANHVIRSISGPPIRRVVRTVAGVPGIPGHRDGELSFALLHSPSGIVAASSDAQVVYVADTANHVLRCLTPSSLSTLAGRPLSAGHADGPLSGAAFSSPAGLAVLPDGRLLVADAHNNCIRRLCFSRRSVVTLAGGGGPKAWGAVDGSAAAARFNLPRGVAVGAAGEVWIADTGNNCVRVLCMVPGEEAVQRPRSPSHLLRGEAVGGGGDGGAQQAASPDAYGWLAAEVAPSRPSLAAQQAALAELFAAPPVRSRPPSAAPSPSRGGGIALGRGATSGGGSSDGPASPVASSRIASAHIHTSAVSTALAREASESAVLSSTSHTSSSGLRSAYLGSAAGQPSPPEGPASQQRAATPARQPAGATPARSRLLIARSGGSTPVRGAARGGGGEPSFEVQLFERAQPRAAAEEEAGAWRYVGAARVSVGPALLDTGAASLPRFGLPALAELLVRPAAGAARRTLIASVAQIGLRESVFVSCVPPPPTSPAVAALARATGARSEVQVGLRFRSAEVAAAFLARCRQALNLAPGGLTAGGASPPGSPSGLAPSQQQGPLGADAGAPDASRREVLILQSQLAEREGEMARLSRELAEQARRHRLETAELRSRFDEESAYWHSHMEQLAKQTGARASLPTDVLPRRMQQGGRAPSWAEEEEDREGVAAL